MNYWIFKLVSSSYRSWHVVSFYLSKKKCCIVLYGLGGLFVWMRLGCVGMLIKCMYGFMYSGCGLGFLKDA